MQAIASQLSSTLILFDHAFISAACDVYITCMKVPWPNPRDACGGGYEQANVYKKFKSFKEIKSLRRFLLSSRPQAQNL